MASPDLKPPRVRYPESDGTPMGETELHRDLLIDLIVSIHQRFLDDPGVYASGNMFLYFEEGSPEMVVCPDFFVVRGVPKKQRRVYKLWEEKKAPELVIELTSRATHLEDLGKKRAIYEQLGVEEYFIFDPEGIRFDPPFQGFRRKGQLFEPLREVRVVEGARVFLSSVLGLELHGGGTSLRWVDPATGEPLAVPREAYAAAAAERQRAEAEKHRAEGEKLRAEAAEAENARLRDEIARLKGRPHGGD